MSDSYPAGPAARARFEELAGRHPERVTLNADMEDFAVECFQVLAKAQYDIEEGAEVAAVERSVAAEVQKQKRMAVEAMRAAYAEALALAIAGARARAPTNRRPRWPTSGSQCSSSISRATR